MKQARNSGKELPLRLRFAADERAVRGALESACSAFRAMQLNDEQCGTAELVLAEVLNNIVEHAYAGRERGQIEVEITSAPAAIDFLVSDSGHPMPGGTVPEGRVQNLNVPPEELPEGGYGWYLIRALTDQLAYRREGGKNKLHFRLSISLGAVQAGA